MSSALIAFLGSDIYASIEGGADARFDKKQATPKLRAWAKRYDKASQHDNEEELSKIGREMFAWLDESGWASAWALGPEDRNLEIRVEGREDADEEALLDAPWELLARGNGVHFAFDEIQLFVVARRIGAKTAPLAAKYVELQLMFMAAAPEGANELDYEAEEAAILEATRRLPMRVVVEETGALEFLGARLNSDEAPFEALHISCHGDIGDKGPILWLETAEGGAERAGPGAIVKALGAAPPPLVMLSACRTAERGAAAGAAFVGRKDGVRESGNAAASTLPELAAPFVRQLAKTIANVVGWDGSVYDTDATAFATYFYKELAGRSPVPRAAAVARRALRLEAKNPSQGRHWHLARVYVGPGGGGPLCGQGKKRPSVADGAKWFLDKARRRVAVASRAEFVGRRREIQRVLKWFRESPRGVLIHGMGALGKSSLAARVQSRMPQHRPVVIFELYDALAIFDEVLEALAPDLRGAEKARWRETVKGDAAALGDALESWLTDPLDEKPILLIIDDLERILEAPTQSDAPTGVLTDYRKAMAAVLLAFDRAPTRSRLLLTSRYDFRLPDGAGGDLAAGLLRAPLKPMAARERLKQWRAAERGSGRATAELDAAGRGLLSRALAAAAGNPGLTAILIRPLLVGEIDKVNAMLRQLDTLFLPGAQFNEIGAAVTQTSSHNAGDALEAFAHGLSFPIYRAALTSDQAQQLAAATLFTAEVPIPCAALAAAGQSLGVEVPENAVARLIGLGLFDDWGLIDGVAHSAVNPLAVPLAPSLDLADRQRAAKFVLRFLDDKVNETGMAIEHLHEEMTRLAFLICTPNYAVKLGKYKIEFNNKSNASFSFHPLSVQSTKSMRRDNL